MITIKELVDNGILIDNTTPLLEKRRKERYVFPLKECTFQIEKIGPDIFNLIYIPGDSSHRLLMGVYSTYEEVNKRILESILFKLANSSFGFNRTDSFEFKQKADILTIEKLKVIYTTSKLYNGKGGQLKQVIKNLI